MEQVVTGLVSRDWSTALRGDGEGVIPDQHCGAGCGCPPAPPSRTFTGVTCLARGFPRATPPNTCGLSCVCTVLVPREQAESHLGKCLPHVWALQGAMLAAAEGAGHWGQCRQPGCSWRAPVGGGCSPLCPPEK